VVKLVDMRIKLINQFFAKSKLFFFLDCWHVGVFHPKIYELV